MILNSLYVGLSYSKLTSQELKQIRQENEKFYLKLAVFVFILLSLSRLFSSPVINVDETINDSQTSISEKIEVQTDPFGQSNLENEPWVQKILDMSGGDLTPTPAPPSNFGIENSWKPTLSQNKINRNSGPGARARADAMRDFRNGQQKKSTTKAGVADAFKPNTSYSHYNHYKRATSALQAKNSKPNKWLDQLPIDSPSRYREGPSPFANYQYNGQHNGQNLDFSNQKVENHMFDRHAKKALNIEGNRNKETQAQARNKLLKFIDEPNTERRNGSYRYERPAYHYLKSLEARGENNLILTVDAETNQPISIRNATEYQFRLIDKDGNLGLDARPPKPDNGQGFSVVLRLRGGPNFNF